MDSISSYINNGATSNVVSYTPTWTGTGLVYPQGAVTGSYIRIGKLVHFTININCATVTNFGTGQYSVTLPFTPSVQYVFRDGQIFNGLTNQHYRILAEGIEGTSTMLLWTNTGGTNNDLAFQNDTPTNLNDECVWYVSGTYICV